MHGFEGSRPSASGQFEAIARACPVMMWACDTQGRVVFVNEAWERFFGTTLEHLRNDWLTLLHAADAERYRAVFDDAMRRRTPLDARCRVRRADGEWRWVHNYASPYYGPGGAFLGLVGSSPDVTTEVEREAALRESEERFRTLADTAPVIIWMFEADGNCSFVSRAWEEFTGQPREAALGSGWLAALHPHDETEVRRILPKALSAPAPCSREFRLRTRDGSYRSMLSPATPRYAQDGAFAGYIGSVLDITDRKQQENALREADAQKDVFLAILAHELRNPLAPLANAAAMLQLGARRGEIVTAGKMIDRQVKHLARLVDDLLDVARLVNGKLQLRRTRTAVRDVVLTALEATQPYIDARGHELSTSVPSVPAHVFADATRLAQVLINLLTNAAKYTPKGGHIRLAVTVDRKSVEFQVTDTGSGIPSHMLDHIFGMFNQQSSQALGKQEGLGIGLALARGIVTMHEGTIGAHSEGAGKGSTFTVRVPRMAEADAFETEPQLRLDGSEYASKRAPSTAESCRVLVVDDNADSANSLVMLLELMGYEAHAAFNGRSALELLPSLHPQVVVLDIGLPDISGHDVAKQIRQKPWGREVFLVALTGFGQPDDIERSHAAGFDRHLTKPVDSQELLKLVGACHRGNLADA